MLGRARTSLSRSVRLAEAMPATRAHTPRAGSPSSIRSRIATVRLDGAAWGAISATAAFIALTCWWLSEDQSVPIYDAGNHLDTAIHYHTLLRSGDILGPFNHVSQYPPLVHLLGALAMFVGGVNVATPIIAANLVFVPLLALGCYKTAELLFGRGAGLLAVIFVLGSPLLIAQFHVFMLDAPETALVSVSIWLLLASKDFSETRFACLAGVAVGCGLLVKVQFPFFLAGIVLVALARGGRRNWRGAGAFLAIAFVIASPWYIDHLSELKTILRLAGAGSGAAAGNLPPTVSGANLTWYWWSTLNSQLFAPLALLVLGGFAWTARELIRRKEARGLKLDFVIGGFVAWLAISLTRHHDIRYDMPLMPYLAVIGTGWIVSLPRGTRIAASAFTVLAVVASTLGITFGVGKTVQATLVATPATSQALPGRIVVYSTSGFLVGKPERDGDIPGLLAALRADGVRTVAFSRGQGAQPDFSFEGLLPLARIARLAPVLTAKVETAPSASVATLVHKDTVAGTPAPCRTLSDGTGVWVVRYDTASGKLRLFCPGRTPRYYSSLAAN